MVDLALRPTQVLLSVEVNLLLWSARAGMGVQMTKVTLKSGSTGVVLDFE